MMGNRTISELQQLQQLPLAVKIEKTKNRIKEWVDYYGEDGVYVSFSGGKDSTVLLHLVRELYPDVTAVFCDTGLEFPEIRSFVKTFDNVVWLKPNKSFAQIVKEYGYPIISKEVSEAVYGARKYLTAVINEIDNVDRQTDRQLPYAQFYRKLCGIGEYRTNSKQKNCLASEDMESTIWQSRAEQSIAEQSSFVESLKSQNKEELEVVEQSTDSLNVLEYLQAISKSKQDLSKIIANVRVQRCIGILPRTGLATMETIPSKPDRSQYSCERYSFLLLAPFETANHCCKVMKKQIAHKYAKDTGRKPITAQMASESRLRSQQWMKNGCNAFEAKQPISNPMSFWTEQDVLEYCYLNNIKLARVYGDIVREHQNIKSNSVEGQMCLDDLDETMFGIFDIGRPTYSTTGCNRTGCFPCLFGKHREKDLSECRINMIKKVSNPKFADWMLRGGAFDENGLWKPKGGLGMWFVMEWCNKYGDMKYVYPDREYYINKYSTEETEKYLHLLN